MTSLAGAASRWPWAGEVEGEGDGAGDGAADDCDGEAEGSFVIVTDGVAGLAVGVALCVGEGVALTPPGVALDGAPDTPPPSPRVEACVRCDPPDVMITVIPAAVATAAITATAAIRPGRRWTRRHHRQPDGRQSGQ